jgi:NAD(P)-dependent dehydrogenase (short-subunit alcohol dehydrogenase family)
MLNFDGRVAIVTGAGRGLGRSHALALAERGARVVVNDLGGALDGTGASIDAAGEVVSLIEEAGGEAIANGANVTDFDQVKAMVDEAHDKWGSVDILVNNAGILRDKSFNNMELSDFQAVVDVHLMGSVNATKAVWPIMRDQNYGRIVMTTSSSGLYGNFGQANYGAAKTAVVGFMNTLHLEGAKYNIRVNCLSPAAATRMLEGLIPDEMAGLLNTDAVAAGLVYLVSEDGPSRTILSAGAGTFAVARIYETAGVSLLPDEVTPEGVAAHWDEIAATDGQAELQMGGQQTEKFVIKAADKLGLSLG